MIPWCQRSRLSMVDYLQRAMLGAAMVAVWIAVGQRAAFAQTNNLAQAQKALQTAKKGMEQAQEGVKTASDAVKKAATAKRTATKELQDTREELLERVAEKTGLAAARKQAHDAKAAYDRAATTILKSVRESAEYKQALAKITSIPEKIRLAKEDERFNDEERKREVAKLQEAAHAPQRMEQAALDRDQSLVPLRAEQTRTYELVAEAKKKADLAIAEAPELKAAQHKFDSAREDLVKAEQDLATKRKTLVDAEQRVAMANDSVAAATRSNQMGRYGRRRMFTPVTGPGF